MSLRSSAAKLAILGLLLFTVATCGTGADPADDARTPDSELTADEIMALAADALRSTVSYRSETMIVVDISGEYRQTINSTIEWTAPDRMRNVSIFQTEDDPKKSEESISLGDRVFAQGILSGSDWREIRRSRQTSGESPALDFLNFSNVTLTGVETLDGVEVYRLEGIREIVGLTDGSIGTLRKSSQLMFVSTDNFQIVKVETHAIFEIPEGEITELADGRITGTETKRYENTTVSNLNYFTEPILIEAPHSYVALSDEWQEDWILTPNLIIVTPTPTPTAVPDSEQESGATSAADDPSES